MNINSLNNENIIVTTFDSLVHNENIIATIFDSVVHNEKIIAPIFDSVVHNRWRPLIARKIGVFINDKNPEIRNSDTHSL